MVTYHAKRVNKIAKLVHKKVANLVNQNISSTFHHQHVKNVHKIVIIVKLTNHLIKSLVPFANLIIIWINNIPNACHAIYKIAKLAIVTGPVLSVSMDILSIHKAILLFAINVYKIVHNAQVKNNAHNA